MEIPKLPDAELEIMKIIWHQGTEATSAQIMEGLEGQKEWAVTTVLNFLARLVDRGFLKVERKGKINIYTVIIDENAYLEIESKSFLERLHGSSLKSLVVSLYDGKAISKSDLAELKSFIEEKAGDES